MATFRTGDTHFTVGIFDAMLDRGSEASQAPIWTKYITPLRQLFIKLPYKMPKYYHDYHEQSNMEVHNWPIGNPQIASVNRHLFSKSLDKYAKPGKDVHLNATDSSSHRNEKDTPLLKVSVKVADQSYLHINR